MILFNHVAIIGVGLIGGSIGLDIKNKRLCGHVTGISFHKASARASKQIGAVDESSLDLNSIKDADLVIFATPVNSIIRLAPLVSKIVKKDCFVTDVGSTKRTIVKTLEKLFPNYVGSHPMAGSEKRGILNARSGLLKGSLVIMTPTKKSAKEATRKIKQLWVKMGARVEFISADEHDVILSHVSHLPHIAAFSLINCVPAGYLPFSASGLKDTTRIAASDSELWKDIFLSNAENIVKRISELQRMLTAIKSALTSKNGKALVSIIKKAKNKRELLS